MSSYIARIHDEDDGHLWGEVEQLPGCFISGADLDELMDAAAEAIGIYLADDNAGHPELILDRDVALRSGSNCMIATSD